eukprot:gb/GECG01001130.1/.p1 GENE.gb/GECG01001130.1/~~gb/GECG01001130.1/.p1  ORF type:complete len:970 (+),score=69.47 gb/GECG01001130.1/:1-2910(+)
MVLGTLQTPSAPIQQEWAIRVAELCFLGATLHELRGTWTQDWNHIVVAVQLVFFLMLPWGTRARLAKLRRCARLEAAPQNHARLQWQLEVQCCLWLGVVSIIAAIVAGFHHGSKDTAHTALGQVLLYSLRAYAWLYTMYYFYVKGAFDSPMDEVPLYCLPEFRRARAREFNVWVANRLVALRCWVLVVLLPIFYQLSTTLAKFLWQTIYAAVMECENLPGCAKRISLMASDQSRTLLMSLMPFSVFSKDAHPNSTFVLGVVYLLLTCFLFCMGAYSVLYVSAARCSGKPQSEAEENWQWEPTGQGFFAHQRSPPSITAQTGASLRLVVLTIGTRGDVQPFLTLGQTLHERGHNVVIASSDNFHELIEEHGLEFAPIGISKIDQPTHWLEVKSVGEMMERTFEGFKDQYLPVGDGFYAAVLGNYCNPTERKQRFASEGKHEPADVIIATAHTASFGLNISEATGIPCWQAKLAPDIPSNAFGPPGVETSSYGFLNYIRHLLTWVRIGLAVRNVPIQQMENEWRKNTLKLTTDTPAERIFDMYYSPQLLAVSPLLFPKPLDYPEWVFECGFWTNTSSSGWQAPDWLEKFFEEADRPVVCITFGSMVLATSSGVVPTLANEALNHGYKVLLMTGWADPPEELGCRLPDWELMQERQLQSSPGSEPDSKHKLGFGRKGNLAVIEAAPHDWVFERCSAVCHHGGAGTTASVLASGIPSLVIPILRWADQMQWGDMVEAAGVGVKVRGWPPSTSELRRCLRHVMGSETIQNTANKRGAQMRAERSGELAAHALESCLCTLLLPPEQAAMVKQNVDPSLLSRTQKMCLQHCVHCNMAKKERRMKSLASYVDGRDVNPIHQKFLYAYRNKFNEDPTMSHADTFGTSTQWKHLFLRGFSTFREVVQFFLGPTGLSGVDKASKDQAKRLDASEEETYDTFLNSLLCLFTHTKENGTTGTPLGTPSWGSPSITKRRSTRR